MKHEGTQGWVLANSLRIAVTPATAREFVNTIQEKRNTKALILNHNLHSVFLHASSPSFRQIYRQADGVLIDGFPVLVAVSLANRVRIDSRYRIGSTDWIEQLAGVKKSLRVFVYGATPQSNEKCVQEIQRKSPLLTVTGLHGYVDEQQAINAIQQAKPELVIVGLGMPRQEEFLHRNWELLPTAVYATVGGAIDYVAGTTRLAPRWLGRVGMEWLWRLAHSPRRLASRYLVEPVLLLPLLLRVPPVQRQEKEPWW